MTESRLIERLRARRLVFGSFLVLATILLFLISRGKWSDAGGSILEIGYRI